MERFSRVRAAVPGATARATTAVALTALLVLSTLVGHAGAAAPAAAAVPPSPAAAAGSHPAAADPVEANVTDTGDSRLRGEVQETSGEALGGVEVEIVNTDNGSVVGTVTTASDGSWGPLQFPPGNYTARLVSWRWEAFSTTVGLETAETEKIFTSADPKTGYLRLDVVDTSGASLGGVDVEIVNVDDGSVVRTVTTASDGTWQSEFQVGNYTARIAESGWETFATVVMLEKNETERIDVTGDRQVGKLRLEVTDTSGNPLGGVTVEIVNTDNGSVVRTATTQSDGSWGPEQFPAANFTARIADPGWESSASDLQLADGESKKILVTGTSTSGSLSGAVTDAGGSALTDATVQVVNATNGSVVATVPVDASGSWGPVTVPRGGWEVSATRNGYEPATRSVTVAGGSMTTVDLSLAAALSVDVQSTSSPVTVGETLSVTARVENTAGSTVSGTVVLAVDGTRHDSSTLTLSAGEVRTVTLAWQTGSGDGGTHTATVDAGADTASTGVSVTDAGALAVDITGTDAPVAPGEALAVEVRLENTAGREVTETVSLSVGGEQRDSREVTLAAGESTTVTLTWDDATSGAYTATVQAGGGGDSTEVTVGSAGSVAVEIAGTNAPVDPGEQLSVDVELANTGDAALTATVTLSVDDRRHDSREVELAAGEQRTVTLGASVEEPGRYTLAVAVGDRMATTEVVVGPTEVGGPGASGLGVVAALVALLAALVLVRRRG